MYKILVTGIGAIIGYGVINSLKKYNKDIFIVGSDIYNDNVARNWVNVFVQAPLTSSQEYIEWIKAVVKEHAIDLIIPGIEQDSIFVALNKKLFEDLNVKVVCNNPELVKISMDKWKLYRFLQSNYSEVLIPSSLSTSFENITSDLGTPFLLKPRDGYAGKGIKIINKKREFNQLKEIHGDNLMAQKFIGDNENEFTV